MDFVWATINSAGLWNIFIEVFLLLMALTFALLGVLTAYFGSGKSRMAGIALLVVGILIPIILYFVEWIHKPGYFMNNLLLPGLIYIGAGLIGVIVGFLVFLGIIMKT